MEIRKGAVLKGRYRLDHMLGRGGMASVWRGHDSVLDRPVAVKVLSDTIASDPDFLARFRREATVAAALSHPNLVRVYDYGEAGERPYLVMEMVPGEDLAGMIERKTPVDRERLAAQLLAALDHIHRAGIVHRDVKPQNVLVERDGNAKLIDFGIALPRDATALTSTGLVLATRSYAAPEVMRGEPATERSDLYSCGLVLAACDGRRVPELEALVARLTSEDPAGRPTSAAAALADLEQRTDPLEPTEAFAPVFPPAAERTPEPSEPTAAYPPGSRNRRRWAVALGLVAACIAIVAVVLAATGGGGSGHGSRAVGQKKSQVPRSGAAANQNQSEEETAPPEEEPATTVNATPAGNDAARASSLNEQGYELIQAGEYEQAVPVLEESVSAFPAGTEDVDYAYALFNLGDALLRSGRPEEAIPVLEQRLQIPNQTDVVAAELEAARSEAGAAEGPGGLKGDEGGD
jgi:serine/threonine-protein kinase